MAFWRKKRPVGGKHRGVSRKEARAAEAVPIPDEALPAIELEESTKDDLAAILVSAFRTANAQDEAVCELLLLLQRRAGLRERLTSLETRVERVQNEAEAQGALLEQIKLDKLLSDMEAVGSDTDVAEKEKDGYGKITGFKEHRDALKTSVLLMTHLDSSVTALQRDHEDLEAAMLELVSRHASALTDILREDFDQVATRIARLTLAEEYDPSGEGELDGDFDEVLQEISTLSPVRAPAKGDSRFHLD